MSLMEVIRSRHSYRGTYKPDPVPRQDLKAIMEAGLAAPSGCNMQTTSLICVDDPKTLEKIRAVMTRPMGNTAPALICVLPVGVADGLSSGPAKKKFEERAWFNSFPEDMF